MLASAYDRVLGLMSKSYDVNEYLQRFNSKSEFGNNYTYVGFEVCPAVVVSPEI